MPYFEVDFTCSGTATDERIVDAELSENEIQGMNEVYADEGEFPLGVVSLVASKITLNVQRCDPAKKDVCANVTLLIEANDDELARAFAPAIRFLNQIADSTAASVTGDFSTPLVLNSYSWEPMAVRSHVNAPAPSF